MGELWPSILKKFQIFKGLFFYDDFSGKVIVPSLKKYIFFSGPMSKRVKEMGWVVCAVVIIHVSEIHRDIYNGR